MSAAGLPSSPSSARPLAPRRLSRTEAQAQSTLAQRAHDLPFTLDAPWRASLRPIPRADAQLPGTSWTARIEWAGAALMLQLPAEAATQQLEALLSAQLGEPVALAPLPSELAAAATEAALAHVLDALQALGRGAPRLAATQTGVPATPEELAAFPHVCELRLHAESGSQAIAGLLGCDSLGLMLLAGLVARRAPAAGLADDTLPLTLRAEIGACRLTAGELATLEPGDVLLPDVVHVAAGRVLWLSPDGQAGLHVQLPETAATDAAAAPPSLTVLSPWTATMPAASDATATPETLAPATLDAVPMRLSFDLGELTLTLAQLRALQPGQVLELGCPLAGAVRMRANGALIGDGELVDVDGQLGVAVRSLFAPAKPA